MKRSSSALSDAITPASLATVLKGPVPLQQLIPLRVQHVETIVYDGELVLVILDLNTLAMVAVNPPITPISVSIKRTGPRVRGS